MKTLPCLKIRMKNIPPSQRRRHYLKAVGECREKYRTEISERIDIALRSSPEECDELKRIEQAEKLEWAQQIGIVSHKTYLKMDFEEQLTQLEAEEILIRQLSESPFKRWLKLSAKEKSNHWFTKHVHEPESKEKYMRYVKQSRFGKLVTIFEKELLMTPDLIDCLKIIFATVLSAEIRDDTPLWIDIVGSPGSAKTRMLSCVQHEEKVNYFSRITPATLVSGVRTKTDPSIMPLLTGKCLVWKDFTEILALHADDREKMYACLRGAYDGTVHVKFANGVERTYRDVYFSMLTGVTNNIYLDTSVSLGERRLKYKLPPTDIETEKDKIRKAMMQTPDSQELQEASEDFLKFLREQIDTLPTVPAEIFERIVSFAMLISRLRTIVNREKYDIEHSTRIEPEPEVGARLAKQLKKLAQLLAIVEEKKVVDEEIYQIIQKVGFSSPHPRVVKIFLALNSKTLTKAELCEKTKLPDTTIRRTLKDLAECKIVEIEKSSKPTGQRGGKNPAKYSLSGECLKLWRESSLKN